MMGPAVYPRSQGGGSRASQVRAGGWSPSSNVRAGGVGPPSYWEHVGSDAECDRTPWKVLS